MLGYGTAADALDEVLKIAASTSLECLEKFSKGIIECFGAEYLRPPTSDGLEKILQENEARGFPGMIGSIDCMHIGHGRIVQKVGLACLLVVTKGNLL
jgi:hypothetical protein